MEKIKFVTITRTICPKTGVHYLDGIGEDGFHYMSEMRTDLEEWIVFSRMWYKDPQQPYKQ
jgi:hypothetical protein